MTALKRANVGCGQTPTPDWHNYDNSWSLRLAQWPIVTKLFEATGLINTHQKGFISYLRSHHVEWADVTKKIPLPDDYLEVLYSSHMLEHLDRKEALLFIKEAHRVLMSGGIIRISVPDFHLIVDNYLQHKDADRAVEETHLAINKPDSFINRIKVAFVGGRHHHWMYDGQSLSRLLEVSGFVDPQILGPGETTIEDPGTLDLHERSEASVYVEARKLK